MKEIVITVNKKIATVNDSEYIVNGNGDITARFVFDGEWDDVGTKTAVFVLSDGSAYYRTLENNACTVPVIYNTAYVRIGVTSSKLFTSTSATVNCKSCVIDDARSKAPLNNDTYAELCALLDKRIPQASAGGSVLVTDENGKSVWTDKAQLFSGYSKTETDALLSRYAYKRRLNTEAAEITELTDMDDYRLSGVSDITFLCGEISRSEIVLTTAESGKVSIKFEGVKAYSGDSTDLMGNGETWVFTLKNLCLNAVKREG